MDSTTSDADRGSLLLVLPVPMYDVAGERHFDRQATNGLHRWLDNFDSVAFACPVIPANAPPKGTAPFSEQAFAGRCRFHPLPWAVQPAAFLRHLPATTRVLDRLIDGHAHLSFAIGGLFGDWGSVAALRAARRKRVASVWTDRVESTIMKHAAGQRRGVRRLYRLLHAEGIKRYERAVIRRTAIGLFHGADCFAAYSPYSSHPHLVHDIHLTEDARIDPAALTAKADDVRSGRPLRIVYAGRAIEEKGVLDWVAALARLRDAGVPFSATWYGEGADLERATSLAAELDLSDRVAFPGNLDAHDALMARLRAADLFLFCHKVPESPRCLIEALISGTPIVGYGSSYPADLVAGNGGGVMTDHSPDALAATVARLAGDRARIAELMRSAAADGYPHTDRDVFRHRSEIIKAAGGRAD